jgi:uncharacterized coiled-coil protein SlyX
MARLGVDALPDLQTERTIKEKDKLIEELRSQIAQRDESLDKVSAELRVSKQLVTQLESELEAAMFASSLLIFFLFFDPSFDVAAF